ncbi:hypothetical protein N7468_005700 [Penicillium chermesinum]|uniref:Protein kinase domain-containing protein n=1 Tax=Penicillium chermesinum TaxID=63820 RepID=A0A9W9NZI7_9EURO|nr:uncharacterized protein N7468_005700 [Penicillium chermesinum]KAJ5232744.1 hypothetical protein N7468_005700 [Penicillium chermesinum]
MVATFSPHRDSGGTLHLSTHSGIHHVDASSAIRQLRRSLSRSPSKSSNFFFHSRPQSPSKTTTPYVSSPLSPSRRSQNNFVLFPSPNQQSPLAVPYPPSAKITRPAMRRRTSPRSPAKRVLAVSTDGGNATPAHPTVMATGEENALTLDDLAGPTESTTPTSPCGNNSPTAPLGENLAPRSTLSRIEKRRSGTFGTFATVSPLKRSDGIMNLDQASRGSPEPTSPTATDSPVNAPPINPFSPFATIPKRSSSLRRSTLQQRQSDRPLFGRPKVAGESETPPGTPLAVRPRLSFDSSLFQSGEDNLFTPRPAPSSPLFSNTPTFSPTPNNTNSPAATTTNTTATASVIPPAQPSLRPAAHPLSRTITQSSSGSSLDDSPTHEPVHKAERPRPIFNFSKSLPAGATRPSIIRRATREETNQTGESFATPENYKLVKPLPAAFMSTGLISKKNRNAEEPAGFNKNMPDTPCKRPVNIFTNDSFNKSRPFHEPETFPQSPFNPPTSTVRPKAGPFARGMGIFGNSFNRPEPSRRGSFVSVDGDDFQSQSPSSRHDSQPLADSDFPPTPTKQPFIPSRAFPASSAQNPSLERLSDSKGSAFSTPLRERFLQASPHTPRDQYFPPDPSGLSISVPHDQQSLPAENGSNLPATPTGPRDSFVSSKRPSLQLSGFHTPDVDPCITARFEKVELVGTGEFSQVYKVSQPHGTSTPSIFSLPSQEPKSQALAHQVYAVKKSKQPYLGLKDRERRIREVDVLKTLVHSDHVVSFMDSWENNGHLYIQTEYCEEGSLDVFLAQAGLKARLDDFRIWKILLELALGLKQIHDQGFIHLDLKPANVLVTFEGVLKIGDFGMATRWPAEDGIEGEGDREYIGPEILMGRFDKPADIFSLGLIIFEIAGNVELPDNGASWQKLRNGDMSDVPSLTWSSATSCYRDASGNPVSDEPSFEILCSSDLAGDSFGDDFNARQESRKAHPPARSGELVDPPSFMVDSLHSQALDKIVRWMISPDPRDRPTADQLLATYGVQFVNHRRRAGATVFEGNWGPADEILAEDAEMIDV